MIWTVLAIAGLVLAAIVCFGTLFLVRYLEGAVSKIFAAITACSLAFLFVYIAADFAGDLRTSAANARPALPAGFAYVGNVAPTIETRLRFATTDNLTGQVVDGYAAGDVLILHAGPALALMQVQNDLAPRGLGLSVSDAYRPARADRFLVAWARNPESATESDTTAQARYYPGLSRQQLLDRGYLPESSVHSLGHAVDVTLIDLGTRQPLDMGGPIGRYDSLTRPDAEGLTSKQQRNRARLRDAMLARGFQADPLMWWQYAYPQAEGTQSADFEIR